jgi:hypothetical protein
MRLIYQISVHHDRCTVQDRPDRNTEGDPVFVLWPVWLDDQQRAEETDANADGKADALWATAAANTDVAKAVDTIGPERLKDRLSPAVEAVPMLGLWLGP